MHKCTEKNALNILKGSPYLGITRIRCHVKTTLQSTGSKMTVPICPTTNICSLLNEQIYESVALPCRLEALVASVTRNTGNIINHQGYLETVCASPYTELWDGDTSGWTDTKIPTLSGCCTQGEKRKGSLALCLSHQLKEPLWSPR